MCLLFQTAQMLTCPSRRYSLQFSEPATSRLDIDQKRAFAERSKIDLCCQTTDYVVADTPKNAKSTSPSSRVCIEGRTGLHCRQRDRI